MIIQCPKCSTKFSIDSEIIAGATDPEFHCSRCDGYFKADKNIKDAPKQSLIVASKTTSPVEKNAPKKVEEEPKQLSLITSSKTDKSNAQEPKRPTIVQPPASKPAESNFTADWPMFIEEDLQLDFEDRSSFSTTIPEQSEQESTHFITEEPASDQSESLLTKWELGELEPEKPEQKQFVPEAKGHRTLDAAKSATKPARVNYKPDIKTLKRGIIENTNSLTSKFGPLLEKITRTGRSFRPQIKSPIYVIASVPIIWCALIGIWSFNIKQSPQVLKKILHLEPINSPELPPSGLELVDLKSERISLTNGATLIEVSGAIANDTLETYYDINVLSVLYDGQNNKLSEKIVNSNNALMNATISSQSPDGLDHLQNRKNITELILRPNDRSKFKMVFLENVDSANWSSAKIYSVRRLT
jgi:predicted Zn finger-like uncharacterized protein